MEGSCLDVRRAAAAAGQGRHSFLDGSYYEGSWVAGERSTGVYVSAGGEMEYRGQWRGLLRHGQGTLFQKGLFKYTGAQPSQVADVQQIQLAIHVCPRMSVFLLLGGLRIYNAPQWTQRLPELARLCLSVRLMCAGSMECIEPHTAQ